MIRSLFLLIACCPTILFAQDILFSFGVGATRLESERVPFIILDEAIVERDGTFGHGGRLSTQESKPGPAAELSLHYRQNFTPFAILLGGRITGLAPENSYSAFGSETISYLGLFSFTTEGYRHTTQRDYRQRAEQAEIGLQYITGPLSATVWAGHWGHGITYGEEVVGFQILKFGDLSFPSPIVPIGNTRSKLYATGAFAGLELSYVISDWLTVQVAGTVAPTLRGKFEYSRHAEFGPAWKDSSGYTGSMAVAVLGFLFPISEIDSVSIRLIAQEVRSQFPGYHNVYTQNVIFGLDRTEINYAPDRSEALSDYLINNRKATTTGWTMLVGYTVRFELLPSRTPDEVDAL